MLKKKAPAPTPQELYKARKQREESERDALLPPGLINHGNTCFMNSVLQGLISTDILEQMIRFRLPSSYLPLTPYRSPALTNGAGGRYAQPWTDGMKLSDIFLKSMEKAWKCQDNKSRLSMSPKDILTVLGTKYDQYLDFRQQDAHEFLRHLLDAMRMEEFDIIKKRQPPVKRRRLDRQRTFRPGDVVHKRPLPDTPIPEEQRLVSFVDMVFGGRLASILVCGDCKHVSITHEDFNDLSLSIRPDEAKEKKRDRFRQIAKKLRFLSLEPAPRAQSVPSSPSRKPAELAQLPLDLDDPRRRSADLEESASRPIVTSPPAAPPSPDIRPSSIPPGNSNGLDSYNPSVLLSKAESFESSKSASVTFAAPAHPLSDAPEESEKEKESDFEAFGKRLGRRVSVGLGFKKNRHFHGRRSREVSREDKSATSSVAGSIAEHSLEDDRSRSPSPRPRPIPITRPKKSHSSKARDDFFRRILADTNASSSNPLAIFKAMSNGSDSTDKQSLWNKLAPPDGLEECLRQFTAVEVLDGEDMVGCRKCWKIANQRRTSGTAVSSSSSDEGDDTIEDEPRTATRTDFHPSLPGGSEVPLVSPISPISSTSSASSARRTALRGPRQMSSSQAVSTYAGRPVPTISTTAPEIPEAFHTASPQNDVYDSSLGRDRDSLSAPPRTSNSHHRYPAYAGDSSGLSSGESGSDLDSDTSTTTSLASDVPSSKPTPRRSASAKARRAKEVIPRRMYKRYLIATPPPVLVVHFKRFQQVSKGGVQFFSGLKKIDDYVPFPEMLDLQPYIAPRPEDFGLKNKKGKKAGKGKENSCVYRLYAVVVHIGNMLGGHYVAYTALPSSSPTNDASETTPVTIQVANFPPPTSDKSSSSTDEKQHSKSSERQWCYVSDTAVRLSTLEEALKAKAYICMYERV